MYNSDVKLMTYNLLNGGENGIDKIIEIIKNELPDFLTINEANSFTDNDFKILKDVATAGNFVNYKLALSGQYNCHVAVFSRYLWKCVEEIRPVDRACLLAEFDTSLGKLSVGGLHLTPYTEDRRITEIDLITRAQSKYENKILMGDMNSLTEEDGYDEEMIKGFNEKQIKKFTAGGKFRFDAMKRIMSSGYVDPAVILKKNKIYTAPTSINEYGVHTNMRLDYILVSKTLRKNIGEYNVVKNVLSEVCSDHYPVTLELKNIDIL